MTGRRAAAASGLAVLSDLLGYVQDDPPEPDRPELDRPPAAHGVVNPGTQRVTSSLETRWNVESDVVRDLHPEEVLWQLGMQAEPSRILRRAAARPCQPELARS